MPKLPSLEEMLKAGVHFGHKSSHWHPKMEANIFAERVGIHIIDLEMTLKKLEEALAYIKGVAARGGVVLFVGTKRQAQDAVKKYADACSMPYVNSRWLGGTLTNFDQIKQVIKKYTKLKDQKEKGELGKYTKKEQLWITREIEELEQKVGGIEKLEKLPDVIFIVDIRREKTVVQEAKVCGVKLVAITDTNVNPENVDYSIPANDDAVMSIDIMLRLVSEAVAEGKKEAPKEVEKPISKAKGVLNKIKKTVAEKTHISA